MEIVLTRMTATSKIFAIKELRAAGDYSLKEAKDVCDRLEAGTVQTVNVRADALPALRTVFDLHRPLVSPEDTIDPQDVLNLLLVAVALMTPKQADSLFGTEAYKRIREAL